MEKGRQPHVIRTWALPRTKPQYHGPPVDFHPERNKPGFRPSAPKRGVSFGPTKPK
jgi:hypothetical protein